MSKKAEIVIDTKMGQTENINVKEIVKQGSIFGPIMCCATTLKVINVRREYNIVMEKLISEYQFI